jgi:hypothetical protein
VIHVSIVLAYDWVTLIFVITRLSEVIFVWYFRQVKLSYVITVSHSFPWSNPREIGHLNLAPCLKATK